MRAALVLICLACAGCAFASRHPEFTEDKVPSIRQGLTPEDAIGIFGEPDSVSAHNVGQRSHLEYFYDMGIAVENVFRFRREGDRWVLDSWDLEAVHRGGAEQ